ncbi:MAG TPA: carboxypeptidase-like regulatory domain-containing protein [Bryobacteraceae bacterium]|nr:carboxypeptidase-like regulatory domain-containing protein [Bryobacteraceae bacterium]
MTRAAILAAFLFGFAAHSLTAGCRELSVPVPNDPTLSDKLIGLIGPAAHVVAFVGIVKGNIRLAAVAEGANFLKDTYDYINKLSPQERRNLEVCDAPPPALNTALGTAKPVLIGTRNDLDGLFKSTPAHLAPINNDFASLGARMALPPLGGTLAQSPAAPLKFGAIFGTISGVVKGSDGLPMPGVVVWLLQEDGSSSLHVTTDASGAYSFLALPGDYVLAAYNLRYRGWSLHIEMHGGGVDKQEIRFVR